MRQYRTILYKVGAVFLALTFWQIAAVSIHQSILLVTPVSVAKRLLTIYQEPGFRSAVLYSLRHTWAGFLLGLFIGILLAFFAAYVSWGETLLWPWITCAKSVPVASFVVICLIWMSNRNLSVFIVFLIVTPVVYQNLLSGLRARDPELQEMARIFRMKPLRRLRYLTVPQLFPYLYAACRVSIGMAWKAGIAAEIIGTPAGSIGKMLYLAKTYLDTDDLLAWTVIIVVLSLISEKLFLFVLRRLMNGGGAG